MQEELNIVKLYRTVLDNAPLYERKMFTAFADYFEERGKRDYADQLRLFCRYQDKQASRLLDAVRNKGHIAESCLPSILNFFQRGFLGHQDISDACEGASCVQESSSGRINALELKQIIDDVAPLYSQAQSAYRPGLAAGQPNP